MKEYFRTSEVAKFLNVTSVTVVNWINEGKLPAYATAGGHYRIMRKDLINFIRKQGRPIPDELKSSKEKYRILIVDDERNIILSVREALEEIGVEIEIREATNGVTAGLELIEFKPHLVVLDVRMPGADGDVVLKAIKDKESLKDTKILIFTGYPDDGRKLVEMGADKMIEKGTKEAEFKPFCKEVCKLLGVKYRRIIPVGQNAK